MHSYVQQLRSESSMVIGWSTRIEDCSRSWVFPIRKCVRSASTPNHVRHLFWEHLDDHPARPHSLSWTNLKIRNRTQFWSGGHIEHISLLGFIQTFSWSGQPDAEMSEMPGPLERPGPIHVGVEHLLNAPCQFLTSSTADYGADRLDRIPFGLDDRPLRTRLNSVRNFHYAFNILLVAHACGFEELEFKLRGLQQVFSDCRNARATCSL